MTPLKNEELVLSLLTKTVKNLTNNDKVFSLQQLVVLSLTKKDSIFFWDLIIVFDFLLLNFLSVKDN